MSDVFVTSDSHFDHERIIELCGRPFSSLEEMNETMIERWNTRIKSCDVVYHLGDFAFSKKPERVSQILGRLNGTKHLIEGSHDHDAVLKAKGWNSIRELRTLKKPLPVPIILFHWPIEIWQSREKGTIHLFGHIHEKSCEKPTELRHNVSVDYNDFAPISLDEVKQMMEQRSGIMMTTYREWKERFQKSALFDESIPHFHKRGKVWYGKGSEAEGN